MVEEALGPGEIDHGLVSIAWPGRAGAGNPFMAFIDIPHEVRGSS